MPIIVEPTLDPGASLSLCAIFLNDALDPADAMSFRYVEDGYTIDRMLGGGVASDYGSGRSRAWTTPADTAFVAVTLSWTTPTQREWLVAHRGRTVCFRDHLGHKLFGAYFSVPLSVSTLPVNYVGASNVATLSLTSVTFDEAAA